MRARLTIVILIACLAALLLPAAARAWSNGDDWGNGYGTHDWVLQEANRLAAKQGAGWVRLKTALPHTDDPDTEFHDFWYHVYDVWGADHYGDAPKKVMEYYGKARAARKAGNAAAADKYAGIMAHYYADICCPLHTDQSTAEEQDALAVRGSGRDAHRRGGREPRLGLVRRLQGDRRRGRHSPRAPRPPATSTTRRWSSTSTAPAWTPR